MMHVNSRSHLGSLKRFAATSPASARQPGASPMPHDLFRLNFCAPMHFATLAENKITVTDLCCCARRPGGQEATATPPAHHRYELRDRIKSLARAGSSVSHFVVSKHSRFVVAQAEKPSSSSMVEILFAENQLLKVYYFCMPFHHLIFHVIIPRPLC